jgi:ribose-phosphate pyrophosphokinase
MIMTAGAEEILTIELHSHCIKYFFDIPVHELSVCDGLTGAVASVLPDRSRTIVVSPDVGGARR